MVKIYPPTEGMKGTSNMEVYLYDDGQSSSMHRLFMPPLPVQSHLESRGGTGHSSRLQSATQRPSMLAASQLKALLSPGRNKSRGRPRTTATDYTVEDIDDGFGMMDNPETPDVTGSRRLKEGGSSAVHSLYYCAPDAQKKPSFSSRSPRAQMHTKNHMVVVSKDSRSENDSFSGSTSLVQADKTKRKKGYIRNEDLKLVESNLNECVISMAVVHATDKVELENKLSEIQAALVYAQRFQHDILLQKVIESDERSLLVESQLRELETVVRLSDKVVMREEIDQKMERIGNFLDEMQILGQEQQEKDKERDFREVQLTAERDALKEMVENCAAEIAQLRERLDATESTVRSIGENQPPPSANSRRSILKTPTSGRRTIRDVHSPTASPAPGTAADAHGDLVESEPPPSVLPMNLPLEKNGNGPVPSVSVLDTPIDVEPLSSPGKEGSVWADEGSVGEAIDDTSSMIEERLNTASVIQSKIRDNETLLVRLNAVRSKIKSEITSWCSKFEEVHGRSASDSDKSEILPFYKAYHEASLLYKQTIKELESLRGQHTDVKEQIKGSFSESIRQHSRQLQSDVL